MGDVVRQPDVSAAAGELRLIGDSHSVAGPSIGRRFRYLDQLATHVVLLGACAIVLGPVVLIFINSLKTRESIFGRPFDLPFGNSFSLAGYELVFGGRTSRCTS